MEIAELNAEIHFLIRLPDYLKEKQQEINDIYDYIKHPVSSLNELGHLTMDCPPTHDQAIYIAEMRARIEKEMERAINRGRRLVKAINSLEETNKKRLIDYYTKGTKDDIQAIFKQLWAIYTKERDIENKIREIRWREQVKERAKVLKQQLEGVL